MQGKYFCHPHSEGIFTSTIIHQILWYSETNLFFQDFQYYEEGKDQGINVREKSKQLEALLKDDERLKNERVKALKARERFAQQTTGFGTGSDPNVTIYFSISNSIKLIVYQFSLWVPQRRALDLITG